MAAHHLDTANQKRILSHQPTRRTLFEGFTQPQSSNEFDRLLPNAFVCVSASFLVAFGHLVGMSNSHERDISRDQVQEIGEILAAGLMRLLAAKSSELSPDNGESSLDFSPDQSSHPANSDRRITHD